MTIKSDKLIQNMVEINRINIHQTRKINTVSTEELNWRVEHDSWSI